MRCGSAGPQNLVPLFATRSPSEFSSPAFRRLLRAATLSRISGSIVVGMKDCHSCSFITNLFHDHAQPSHLLRSRYWTSLYMLIRRASTRRPYQMNVRSASFRTCRRATDCLRVVRHCSTSPHTCPISKTCISPSKTAGRSGCPLVLARHLNSSFCRRFTIINDGPLGLTVVNC